MDSQRDSNQNLPTNENTSSINTYVPTINRTRPPSPSQFPAPFQQPRPARAQPYNNNNLVFGEGGQQEPHRNPTNPNTISVTEGNLPLNPNQQGVERIGSGDPGAVSGEWKHLKNSAAYTHATPAEREQLLKEAAEVTANRRRLQQLDYNSRVELLGRQCNLAGTHSTQEQEALKLLATAALATAPPAYTPVREHGSVGTPRLGSNEGIADITYEHLRSAVDDIDQNSYSRFLDLSLEMNLAFCEIQRDLMNDNGELRGVVNGMRGTVNELEGSVNEMQGKIRQLQGTVDGLQGTVNNLQGTVNNLQGTINGLQGQLGDMTDMLREALHPRAPVAPMDDFLFNINPIPEQRDVRAPQQQNPDYPILLDPQDNNNDNMGVIVGREEQQGQKSPEPGSEDHNNEVLSRESYEEYQPEEEIDLDFDVDIKMEEFDIKMEEFDPHY
ncbi:hypothetical protein GGS21DRAFT_257684 [Xylaria nigripes]|nr:hypothetical protein GGS21DRAFT_257684 [Xylaria nigripes]